MDKQLKLCKRLLPKNIISMYDLSKEAIEGLFSLASMLEKSSQEERKKILKDKIVAVLFYQPSTRTRLNFHSAVLNLGGDVIGFSDPSTTRAGDFYKETLEDVISFTAPLCDLIVLRHFENFAAKRATSVVDIPIVNAGDGYNEHPTQALGDIWTMYKELGTLNKKTIGLLGDLSIRSLKAIIISLSKFPIEGFNFLLPPEKKIPDVLLNVMKENKIKWNIVKNVDSLFEKSDIVETIGINHPNHNLSKDIENKLLEIPKEFLINKELIKRINSSIPILHPGPRTNELTNDVDQMPNAAYFRQVRNGLFMRMAILGSLLVDE
ncbi:MAG: aspartate carbamoyltransferase [Proteobacteria bacterium]|nr:aspartate carbamoyltransferase [Pseudomonadota bacterium]